MLVFLLGILIAIWFGRTAGRLGHGFARAALWSLIGLSLFVAPLLGLTWLYDVIRDDASEDPRAERVGCD